MSSAQSKNAREYWQQPTLSSEDGQLAKTANGIAPTESCQACHHEYTRMLSAEGAKPDSNNRWKPDLGHVGRRFVGGWVSGYVLVMSIGNQKFGIPRKYQYQISIWYICQKFLGIFLVFYRCFENVLVKIWLNIGIFRQNKNLFGIWYLWLPFHWYWFGFGSSFS